MAANCSPNPKSPRAKGGGAAKLLGSWGAVCNHFPRRLRSTELGCGRVGGSGGEICCGGRGGGRFVLLYTNGRRSAVLEAVLEAALQRARPRRPIMQQLALLGAVPTDEPPKLLPLATSTSALEAKSTVALQRASSTTALTNRPWDQLAEEELLLTKTILPAMARASLWHSATVDRLLNSLEKSLQKPMHEKRPEQRLQMRRLSRLREHTSGQNVWHSGLHQEQEDEIEGLRADVYAAKGHVTKQREQHAAVLAQVTGATSALREEVEKVRALLIASRAAHDEECMAMHDQHDATITALQEQHEAYKTASKKASDSALDECRAEHAAAMKECRAQHAAELEQQRGEAAAALEAAGQRRLHELQLTAEAYENAQATSEAMRSSMLRAAEERRTSELDAAEARFLAEQEALACKVETVQSVKSLQEAHVVQLNAVRREHEDQLAVVAHRHDAALTQLEAQRVAEVQAAEARRVREADETEERHRVELESSKERCHAAAKAAHLLAEAAEAESLRANRLDDRVEDQARQLIEARAAEIRLHVEVQLALSELGQSEGEEQALGAAVLGLEILRVDDEESHRRQTFSAIETTLTEAERRRTSDLAVSEGKLNTVRQEIARHQAAFIARVERHRLELATKQGQDEELRQSHGIRYLLRGSSGRMRARTTPRSGPPGEPPGPGNLVSWPPDYKEEYSTALIDAPRRPPRAVTTVAPIDEMLASAVATPRSNTIDIVDVSYATRGLRPSSDQPVAADPETRVIGGIVFHKPGGKQQRGRRSRPRTKTS